MKKARCLLSLLLCALLVCFPGAAQETPDFCEEYAALNGAPTPDGLHRYAAVELGAEVPFTYAGIEEVAALLEDGTGVLYLGFSRMSVVPLSIARSPTTPACAPVRQRV